MSNSIDPDKTAHMSRLIWIYAVWKSLLLLPVAVKELIPYINLLNLSWIKMSAFEDYGAFKKSFMKVKLSLQRILSLYRVTV